MSDVIVEAIDQAAAIINITVAGAPPPASVIEVLEPAPVIVYVTVDPAGAQAAIDALAAIQALIATIQIFAATPYFADFIFSSADLGFTLPSGATVTAVSVNRVSQLASEWTQTGTLLTLTIPPVDGSVVTVSGIYGLTTGSSLAYFDDFVFLSTDIGCTLPSGAKVTAVSVNRVPQFISEWTQTGTLLTLTIPPDDGSIVTVSGIY